MAVATDQRKSVSSRHMRCSTIASLRATATSAFCMPRRLATASPQTFSEDHRPRGLVSSTSAASYSAARIIVSPHFEIRPIRIVSPDW